MSFPPPPPPGPSFPGVSGPGQFPLPTRPLTPAEFAALPHDDAGPRLVTAIWIMIAVSASFLGLRVYSKYLRHHNLWWDDWVLVGAWLCITAESGLLTYATTLGYGRHIYDLPFNLGVINKTILTINIAGTLSLTAATWSKTSFGLTLLRLTEGWMRVLIWFIIVTINVAMGLSALFAWVRCTPVRKSWSPFDAGTCWEASVIVNYNIFSAAYSAAMDLALALLPWKLIWGLQMKKKEKIGVAVAMSCGVFAAITAIVKTTKIPKMLSMDTYDGIDLFIWGNAESCVTIIAASIPILRVFVRDATTTARRYYGTAGADTHAANGYNLGSKSHTVVISSRPRTARDKEDDWSDKSTINEQRTSSSMGRAVQSEVGVEYGGRKNLEYGMRVFPGA
ncbi:hypothetical protein QBC39DRAFT_433348 [Podospora conica]|nr:hypothetical protein QBC39DRAFT_433348 [Schizothecium conicum]